MESYIDSLLGLQFAVGDRVRVLAYGHQGKVGTIAELDDGDRALVADDCLLALWWVPPMPSEALQVVEAWGFTLKNMCGFTWHKETKHGKSFMGMGNLTRANTESCLFAVRGNPQRVRAGVRQYVSAPIGRHSEKPQEVRDRLVQLLGEVPRVELFARDRVLGWDAWGDEV